MRRARLTLLLALLLVPGTALAAVSSSFEMASMLSRAAESLEELRDRLEVLVRARRDGADPEVVESRAHKECREAREIHELTKSFLAVANKKYRRHAALLASLRDRIDSCYADIVSLYEAACGDIPLVRVRHLVSAAPAPRLKPLRRPAIAPTVGAQVARGSARPARKAKSPPAPRTQVPIPLPVSMADGDVMLPAPIVDELPAR